MASNCCHEGARPEGANDIQCNDSFKTVNVAQKVSKIVINGFKSACGNNVTHVQPIILEKIKPKKPLHLKYRGFFLAIMSSLCFSLTAVVVKMLSDYHTVTIGLWRFQGTFLPAIPFILCHHIHEKKKNKLSGNNESKSKELKIYTTEWWKVLGILVLRSVFTCNAFLLHFYSLKYLAVGDALVILSSTPVFAYFCAYILLGEPIGMVPIATSFSTLAGVAFIIRPPMLSGGHPMDHSTLVGTGLAVGATLLATISYTLLRYSRRIHYSITTFFFGVWGTAETMILASALSVLSLPHGIKDWWLAGGLVTLSFFGQISIILALKYEKTGPVTLIKSCEVVFGFIWQVVFWKVAPDLYSCIGALIVGLGIVVIGIRKWVASLAQDNVFRKRFGFVLN